MDFDFTEGKPYPSEHAFRINDPDKYDKIRRQNDKFGKGISVIWGVKKDGKTEIQAIRFDASKYTFAEAKKWIKDHDYHPILSEQATGKANNNIVLEYKSVPFDMKEIKNEEIDGVKCWKFKGYLSTFGNIDLGDDICAKGCFEKSLKTRQPKLMWQHGRDNTKVPLGIFPVAREDDKGLYVEGAMPEDDTFVSGRIVPQMKIKSIDTMSIGFDTKDYELMKSEDRTIRLLKEVDLWEGSLVTFAMNPMAQITDNVKDMIADFQNIGDISRLLKNFFTVSEANDIIHSIKKFQSCKESGNQDPKTPCNEDVATELKKYVENLHLLTKEIKNAGINT